MNNNQCLFTNVLRVYNFLITSFVTIFKLYHILNLKYFMYLCIFIASHTAVYSDFTPYFLFNLI